MCTPPQAATTEFTLSIAGFPEIETAIIGPAYPSGTWVKFVARKFENENKAQAAGELLGDALAMTGAIDMLGIDLGFSRSTVQYSDQVREAMQRAAGREVRSEVHGLMTYEGRINIVATEMRGSSTVDCSHLERQLNRWLSNKIRFTERQKNCASLINDFFFAASPEAQFILCVSAVEALCEQADGDQEHQDTVTKLCDFLETLPVGNQIRDDLGKRLQGIRRQTIRQAYLRKFRMLLSSDDAKSYDRLYGARSKLVHEGYGRGGLQAEANEARELASKLLRAEIEFVASLSC